VKWLLLGALIALLLTIPGILGTAVAVVTALACEPVVVAFLLGLAARPHLPAVRRWTR
jgi:hypothetical protein